LYENPFFFKDLYENPGLAARGNLPLTFQMDAHGNGIWITGVIYLKWMRMAMEDVD
jgi:hypothetical protein